MSGRVDPVALRWLIGGELARLRERGGLSLSEVAALVDLSKTKIGHMEIGRGNQDPEDIAKVLEACATPVEDITRLKAIATKPTGKPWWNRWKPVVPEWFGLFLGLEGMAIRAFGYEQAVVPGLLQTPEYAAAVTAQSVVVEPQDAERNVALRSVRSARLHVEPVMTYHAVVEEGALRRRPASPAIMDEQYAHLLALTKKRHVTLQVLETERTIHAGIALGNYVILDFEGLHSVGYVELYRDALFVREPAKVASYRAAADHMSDTALSPQDTRSLVQDLRKKL